MVAGGFDDISQEGSCEFANMKATSNSETEFFRSRDLTGVSRVATTTRSMESRGTSVQLPSAVSLRPHLPPRTIHV